MKTVKKPCKCPPAEVVEEMAQTFGRPRLQPDGSLIYTKKGFEPPPDIDGYDRDPNNLWRFKPKWQVCNHRLQLQTTKPCGALAILSICRHPEGPTQNRREVDFKICSGCVLDK